MDYVGQSVQLIATHYNAHCMRRVKEAEGAVMGRRHQTQWAAQFAVASELCKQGYEVAFTSGNATPIADLMVVSPKDKIPFLIDVKGLFRKNPWLIKRKEHRNNLFYVLAYVPEGRPNEFFILSQAKVNKHVKTELVRLGRPDSYPVTGFIWSVAANHKDDWAVLPQ
jgi:hypothetical protein